MNTIFSKSKIKHPSTKIIILLILCALKMNAQCDPVGGDQVSYGNNQWIGYVYTNVAQGDQGIAPPNPFVGTYSGYITLDENFGVDFLETEPLTGPDLCGQHLEHYSIRLKMHIDVAPGYYTFKVGGDDGYRLSFDGGATFPDTMQAWFEHGQIDSEGTFYINGAADLVMEYYEGPGESHFKFNYRPAECMATAPTSVINTQISACVGSTTLMAQGGTAGTAVYQWGTGSVVGSNAIGGNDSSVTVYSTGTYWVRRAMYGPCRANPDVPDYTDGYVFNVTATNNAPGDQVSYGLGQWIVYGYQGNNSNMLLNAYKGYFTDSTLSFNSESSFNQGNQNPSNAPGWIGCTWQGDNDFWFEARRSGFECGEYQFTAQKWDDELWVYIDTDGPGSGNEVLAYHYNGWSGPNLVNNFIGTYYLNENSTVRIKLREAGGDASARVQIIKSSSAPVSLTGDSELCFGESTVLTATGGNTGTGGVYQWGTGEVTDASVIAGQTGSTMTVSPAADTTYWVRISFPGYCSTPVTEATTLAVTVDNTVAGTLSSSGTTICKNTGINNIRLTGYNGTIQRWESADDATFTTNVITYSNTLSTLTAANTGALTSSRYFRAVVQDGFCSNIATPALLITVTPAVVYNGTWSGSYDITTAVEITEDFTLPEDIQVCSCLVNNNAVVTVPSAINFTVKGLLTVEDGSNVILENKASLIQIDNIQDSGSIAVTRSSSKIKRLDYTMWSAPVEGQELKGFSPETLDNRFYVYNPLSDMYSPITPYQNFTAATGYLVRAPNNQSATTPAVVTGTFTGQPHNGTVLKSLVYIDLATEVLEEGETPRTGSYNAIGNPYPSPINIYDFIDANEGVIEGQLWFWRKTNNSLETSYCTLTKFAYTANMAPGGFNDFAINPNGVLNTGQGFIVNALTQGSVRFTNSLREGNSSDQFLRQAQNQASRMWINVGNTNGAFSQTVIGYTDAATLGYDNSIDGKNLSDGSINLYSVIDGYNLSIQGRPEFAVEDVVPVGFFANEPGSFTFSLDHADGIFESEQDMYILDGFTGETHNLREGSYTFTSEAGTFNNRFSVVYTETLGNSGHETAPNTIIAYAREKQVNIAAPKEIASVEIYDIRGRVLYKNDNVRSESFTTPVFSFSEGIIIAKIKLTDSTSVTKKIIFK